MTFGLSIFISLCNQFGCYMHILFVYAIKENGEGKKKEKEGKENGRYKAFKRSEGEVLGDPVFFGSPGSGSGKIPDPGQQNDPCNSNFLVISGAAHFRWLRLLVFLGPAPAPGFFKNRLRLQGVKNNRLRLPSPGHPDPYFKNRIRRSGS